MQNVWTLSGVLMVYGASLDAQSHMHHAVQVIWPSNGACLTLADQTITGAAVINANVAHQLQMGQGWVILVEPQSQLGEDLIATLNEQPAYGLHGLSQFNTKNMSGIDSPLEVLLPLFQFIFKQSNTLNNLSDYVQLTTHEQLDSRIERLLTGLNACFEQACLKPEKWKAVDVATDLALSESRFLHLFKEQMGIAWRPFLLWRRILCAVNLLIAGESATHAAYVAGFSDSAHLSRSFRAMFGMSIRQAGQVLSKKNV